ncbi:MAG: response regulator transcription factor [Brevinematia bacterium]
MVHLFVFLNFFSFGLGLVVLVLSFIAYKRHGNIIYKDICNVLIITELYLVLEYSYIYSKGLNIVFPIPFVSLYNILWGIFWIYFFYVLPNYIYHLSVKDVPKFIRIVFIIFCSLSIPYVVFSFLDSGGLFFKIINRVMEFLLISIVIFSMIVLFLNRNKIKVKSMKRYINGLLIYFSTYSLVVVSNYLVKDRFEFYKIFGTHYPSTSVFILIWFLINLNFVLKELYYEEFVEIKIPVNLKKDYQLTDREMEILEMLIKRLTNKEISRQLFISIPTVKTHLANIYQKLDVRNRDELLSFLREEGDN